MSSGSRGTRQARNTVSKAKLREDYRRHRVQQGTKWYNPVLDDPNHPDNPMHWTHGTLQGYRDAGCTACEPCAAAGRAENARLAQGRLDQRLDADRIRAAKTLMATFPDLATDDIQRGADLVVDTHHVRNAYHARVDYDLVPVRLALSKWSTDAGRHVDDVILAEVATTLTAELTT